MSKSGSATQLLAFKAFFVTLNKSAAAKEGINVSDILSTQANKKTEELNENFERGDPFKHVCIDGFFNNKFANALLEAFPSFADSRAQNELGQVGGKDVNWSFDEISSDYAKLKKALLDGSITDYLSKITGIENLVWGGESMYGGGTHENINGMELDVHIDFNYDDTNGYHRRVNMLIYLNKEWEDEWGGSFEIHRDPRDPATDYARTFTPLFNRAVIHETNDRSWHGFKKIRLPKGKEHLSRKSIALYFYTKERPAEEQRGGHATHYIHWPLPETFKPGVEVTAELHDEIHGLVNKRDSFLRLYQDREVELGAQIAAQKHLVSTARDYKAPPSVGQAKKLVGGQLGVFEDNWLSSKASLTYKAYADIKKIRIHGAIPESLAGDYKYRVRCAGREKVFEFSDAVGPVTLELETSISNGEEFKVIFQKLSGPEDSTKADGRELALHLDYLEFV